MNENSEKILDLMKDDAFANAVLGAESAAVVQQLFEEKGVDLSIAEIEELGAALSQPEGELSEDDLENVAGGMKYPTLIPEIKNILINRPNGPLINKPGPDIIRDQVPPVGVIDRDLPENIVPVVTPKAW